MKWSLYPKKWAVLLVSRWLNPSGLQHAGSNKLCVHHGSGFTEPDARLVLGNQTRTAQRDHF